MKKGHVFEDGRSIPYSQSRDYMEAKATRARRVVKRVDRAVGRRLERERLGLQKPKTA